VAILADVGGADVIQALAGCIDAVVAAEAVARDVGMVEIRRLPGCGGMTVVAVVAAREVRRVFASCDYAVMAGEAGADDLGVVYSSCRRPGVDAVTILADVSRVGV
jgi:hypothetical protein